MRSFVTLLVFLLCVCLRECNTLLINSNYTLNRNFIDTTDRLYASPPNPAIFLKIDYEDILIEDYSNITISGVAIASNNYKFIVIDSTLILDNIWITSINQTNVIECQNSFILIQKSIIRSSTFLESFITSTDCTIEIQNSEFISNTGELLQVYRSETDVYLSNCSFSYNKGELGLFEFFKSNGKFVAEKSKVNNNIFQDAILLHIEDSSFKIDLRNISFDSNKSIDGGLVCVKESYNSKAIFEDIVIRNSTTFEGCFLFQDERSNNTGEIELRNISILESKAYYGVLLTISRAEIYTLNLENIYSQNVVSAESGLIELSRSEISEVYTRNLMSTNSSVIHASQTDIKKLELQDIKAMNSSQIQIRASKCKIDTFSIENGDVKELSSFLQVIDPLEGDLLIQNITFHHCKSVNPLISLADLVSVQIVQSTFHSTSIQLIQSKGKGEIFIRDSSFNYNEFSQELISIEGNKLNIERLQASHNAAKSFIKTTSSELHATEVEILDSKAGSILDLINPSIINLEFSLFENCVASSGIPLVHISGLSNSSHLSQISFLNNQVSNSHILFVDLGGGSAIFDDITMINNKGGLISSRGSGKISLINSNITQNSQNTTTATIFSTATTEIKNTKFEDNIGETLIFGGHMTIERCDFKKNQMNFNLLEVSSGESTLANLSLSENTINKGSCVYIGKSAMTFIHDTEFLACNSNNVGGVFGDEETTVRIEKCSFVESFGISGSAIQSKGKLTVNHINISRSRSSISNGAITLTGIKAHAIIKDSFIKDSVASTGGSAISVSNYANMTLENISIHGGLSLKDGSCIVLNSAYLYFFGGEAINCISTRSAGAMTFTGDSIAHIEDVLFQNNTGNEGGALLFFNLLDSVVQIKKSKFYNNSAIQGGAISFSYDQTSTVTFNDCEFINNFANQFGGVYLSEEKSAIRFENSHFSNNKALSGGVGYQDWESSSAFCNCTLLSNFARDFGGSFYMDKYSTIVFNSSSSTNSSTNGSGGVFLLSLRSTLRIFGSTFEENRSQFSGGVLASAFGSVCAATIINSRAVRNEAEKMGGFASFDLGAENSFIVENFNCSFNSAEFGGCFSFDDINFLPILSNVTFEENIAKIYGNDVNSPPQTLKVSIERVSLFSGEEMPSFTVKLMSSTGDLYNLPLQQNFLVVVQSNNDSVRLSGLVQQELEDGVASFSSSLNNKIRVSGKAGKYEIYVGPRRNDLVYNPLRFGKVVEVEIKECPVQGFALVDSICRKIECFECSTQNGVCVSANNCSCQNNFEGLRCDLKAGSFETLDIVFQTLPTINRKRSQTINVEMRDFILQEITKSVGNVTVEYRRFFETETGYIFRVALTQNGEYLEGAQLAQYRTVIQDHFSQNFGITPEMNQQEAFAEILDYNQPVVVIIFVFTFIMVAVTAVVGFFIYLKRDTPVIKASSPLFCLLILIGVTISFMTFLPYVGTQTPFKCAIQPILAPLAFSIIFGNLLAKTFRIYRIFGNRKLRKVAPSNKTLLAYSGAVICVEMLLVIIWLGVDAPKPVIIGPKDQRFWGCQSSNTRVGDTFTALLFVFSGILLIIGTFLAVNTRKAYSAFRESQLIGFSIYGISVVAVSVVPVIYLVPLNLVALFALRSFSVLFVTSFTLLVLFSPKVFAAVKNLELTTTNTNSSTDKPGISLLQSRKSLAQTDKMNGKVYVKENKLFSKWCSKYAVLTQDGFGIFDDERKISGLGMFPVSSYSILKSENLGNGFELILGPRSFQIDCQEQEELNKWLDSLSFALQQTSQSNQTINQTINLTVQDT